MAQPLNFEALRIKIRSRQEQMEVVWLACPGRCRPALRFQEIVAVAFLAIAV